GIWLSLGEIQSLLVLVAGGSANCAGARQLAAEKIAQLNDKIASLTTMRDSLRRLAETCTGPRSRRECPLLHAAEDKPSRGTAHVC
ncbi:MAG: MerR family DNA-binding protein, partial [Acidimicrobiales bacterium]